MSKSVPGPVAADSSTSLQRPRLTAEQWFVDHTFITDEWMEYISQQCIEDGAIPIMERHPRLGLWAFHTLCRNGEITSKEIASEFAHKRCKRFSERDMEDQICRHLRSRGIAFERQVPCEIGIADVMTESTVYEIKKSVADSTIFMAIGQALAYRASLGVAQAVIIARRPDDRAVRIGKLLHVSVLDCEQAIKKGLLR
jgi:hypothetical protein